MKKEFDYIIIGSGLSGLITAYRMSHDTWFDDKSILIIEKNATKNNDRTWCFWEPSGGEFDAIIHKKWRKAFIGNKYHQAVHSLEPFEYKMIRSKEFYDFTRNQISTKTNFTYTEDEIQTLNEHEQFIELIGKNKKYTSSFVLNSVFENKFLNNQNKYPYLKQHFIGWFVKTEKDIFNPEVVTFMDFTVPQKGNTRFMYVLPISFNEALVEYTLFSENLLEEEEYENAIKEYLFQLGADRYEITEKEKGNIPMTCFPFHDKNTPRQMYIGTAGGWTKPSTGYTFYNSVKISKTLISFLKKEKPLNQFKMNSRYWWYDLILLEVLYQKNELGAKLFGLMFKKRNIKEIFNFLNEEQTFVQDLKIIKSMPKGIFTKAFITSIKKFLFN